MEALHFVTYVERQNQYLVRRDSHDYSVAFDIVRRNDPILPPYEESFISADPYPPVDTDKEK